MNFLRLAAAFVLLACVAVAAGDPPTPREFTHRITGLFSPDREGDLRAAVETIPEIKLVRVDFQHAEAVFSYDPAFAFKGTRPEKIIERFDELLRNATHHTMGIAPLDPTPKDKMKRVEIEVTVLDCKACCLAAYESIYKIDGVAAATASRDGRITALIDPAKTSREAIVEALTARNVVVKKP